MAQVTYQVTFNVVVETTVPRRYVEDTDLDLEYIEVPQKEQIRAIDAIRGGRGLVTRVIMVNAAGDPQGDPAQKAIDLVCEATGMTQEEARTFVDSARKARGL